MRCVGCNKIYSGKGDYCSEYCPECSKVVDCTDCGKKCDYEGKTPRCTFLCPECKQQRRAARKELLKKVWAGEHHWECVRVISHAAPPEAFYGATWDTLTGSLQERILPFVRGDTRTLALVGPVGVGKTWAAWATTFATMIDYPGCYFVDWYDLNRWAMDRRLFGDTGDASRDILSLLERCDLLVIDEFAVTKLHEAEYTTVLGIISHRINSRRRTLFITTKNETEIMECVGEAVLSRISSGTVIEMQGKDRRRNGKQQT